MLNLEGLEDRTVLSVSVTFPGVPTWQPEGPAPITNNGREVATPGTGDFGNEAAGAIQSVVVTPAGRVYAGTVNGGVWSSDLVTPALVTANLAKNDPPFVPPNFWVPKTDQEPSLAVSAMADDPINRNSTLWVGTGSLK